MLIAQKAVSRKSISSGQGNCERDDCVNCHINEAVDVTGIPGSVRQNGSVIVPRKVLWKQGKACNYFIVGFE
jgi:hypothetical protein